MRDLSSLRFVPNPVVQGRGDRYVTLTIDIPLVLKSWRSSLFSYEWVLPDGRIKELGELPEGEQSRRREIETRLKQGDPLEMPVLGIGLLENVEIGSGKATFLTLAAHGCRTIPVHIPKSNAKEFDPFRV